MLKNILFIFILFSPTYLSAQKDIVKELEKREVGKGDIRIFQDPIILNLLNSTKTEVYEKGDVKMLKTSGYRIQVYAGNNTREAKSHAEHVAEEIRAYFPEMSVYTLFISPRWICRVGDFTSIEEADAKMREIRKLKKFKELALVREQVLIPIE